jgi:hypothetical protein
MILARITGFRPGRMYPAPTIPSPRTTPHREAEMTYWKVSRPGGNSCNRTRTRWIRLSRTRSAATLVRAPGRSRFPDRRILGDPRVAYASVAVVTTAIEADAELILLIDRDASLEANAFRQQLQRVRHAALTLPAGDSIVREELRALEQRCDGPLEEWQIAVRRARKLLGD